MIHTCVETLGFAQWKATMTDLERVAADLLARLAARNAAQQALHPVVSSYQSLLRECVALGGDLARERQAGAQLRDEPRTARQHAASASEAAKSSPRIQELEGRLSALQADLVAAYRDKSRQAEDLLAARAERDALTTQLRQRVEELAACRREMADLEVRVSDAEEVAESERDARMAAAGELEARLRERERAESEAEALRRENADLVSRVVAVKQELADKMNELMEREQNLARRWGELERERALWKEATEKGVGAVLLGDEDTRTHRVPEKRVLHFTAHEGGCGDVEFSATGAALATGGHDRLVKVWDATTGANRLVLTGLTGSVMGVAWTPDDRLVLGCSADRSVKVYDGLSGREVHTLTGHKDKVTHVRCVGADGTRAVTAGADRCIKLWDLGNGYARQTFLCHSTCNGVAADLTGQTIVSGHFDGALRVWDARSGHSEREVEHLHGAGVAIHGVCAAHVQSLVGSVGKDGSVKVVDQRMLNAGRALVRHADFRLGLGNCSACFSPDDAFLACGSHGGALVAWDVARGGVVAALGGGGAGVPPLQGVSWSKQGPVAVGDRAGGVAVWA